MRLGVFAAASVLTITAASVAQAADPRVVLIHEFLAYTPDRLEARPDGRAVAYGPIASTAGTKGAFLLGPGDRVELLPKPGSDSPPEDEGEGPPRAGRLTLDEDGTLLQDGARAALPEPLLRALGPKSDRRSLTYDVERRRYVLLRSRRPRAIGNGYDDRWSIVWFDATRVLGESLVPDSDAVSYGGTPALAASNGVVWMGCHDGVLRWDNDAWTLLADEASYNHKLAIEKSNRWAFVRTATAFTLGNAAASSAFSVPVSLAGQQRFAPTATTSFVGSFPSLVTATMFAVVGKGGHGGLSDLISGVALVLGTISIPLVALTTFGTGELAFDGTNSRSGVAYLGALGGTAAGTAAWTLASSMLPEDSFKDRWWWLVPLAASFIGTTSTAGYLWAGEGFRKY